MGLPSQTLGGATHYLTRFRLRLQLKQMSNERGQQKRTILHNTHALWEASHNSSFAPQTPYLTGCTFIYEEKPMAKFNGLALNNVVSFDSG